MIIKKKPTQKTETAKKKKTEKKHHIYYSKESYQVCLITKLLSVTKSFERYF